MAMTYSDLIYFKCDKTCRQILTDLDEIFYSKYRLMGDCKNLYKYCANQSMCENFKFCSVRIKQSNEKLLREWMHKLINIKVKLCN